MKKVSLGFIALMFAFFVIACQPQNDIEAHDYWLRAANQGENSALYMLLQNHSTKDDEFIGVTSDIAQTVGVHRTKMDSNSVVQMSLVSSVPLPAGGEAVFAPGGMHVMFIGLKQDLKVAVKVTLVLHFKNHADISLTVPVQEEAGVMNMNMTP